MSVEAERKGNNTQPDFMLVTRVGNTTFVEPKPVPTELLRRLKVNPNGVSPTLRLR